MHTDMNCQDIFDKGDDKEGDVGERNDDKGDGDEGDGDKGDCDERDGDKGDGDERDDDKGDGDEQDGDEGDDDEGDGDETDGDDDGSTQDTMGIPPPDILTAGFVPSTGIFTVLRPRQQRGEGALRAALGLGGTLKSLA